MREWLVPVDKKDPLKLFRINYHDAEGNIIHKIELGRSKRKLH